MVKKVKKERERAIKNQTEGRGRQNSNIFGCT
jgi:hypothetical protein